MFSMYRSRREDGYTIPEVLMAMALIAIIAVAAWAALTGLIGKANSSNAKSDLANAATAVHLREIDLAQAGLSSVPAPSVLKTGTYALSGYQTGTYDTVASEQGTTPTSTLASGDISSSAKLSDIAASLAKGTIYIDTDSSSTVALYEEASDAQSLDVELVPTSGQAKYECFDISKATASSVITSLSPC